MSYKTDKELADRLDAEDRLRKRGMEKRTCKICKGTAGSAIGYCIGCSGRGYNWEYIDIRWGMR